MVNDAAVCNVRGPEGGVGGNKARRTQSNLYRKQSGELKRGQKDAFFPARLWEERPEQRHKDDEHDSHAKQPRRHTAVAPYQVEGGRRHVNCRASCSVWWGVFGWDLMNLRPPFAPKKI
jgi:hypothetical protein